MTLNEIMKDIHVNSVAHGWWDNDRSGAEVRVLIHSELSEALEEDRAGRPGVWYAEGSNKPEGWAIELIDACIRILDYLGKLGKCFRETSTVDEFTNDFRKVQEKNKSFVELLDELHCCIANSYNRLESEALSEYSSFESVTYKRTLGNIFAWLSMNGYDPEELLLLKHEYNKTRPYKHGKKY